MSVLAETMRTEIHSLHSRTLTPYAEDRQTLMAELDDCLNRAERLATESPSDQALLRLIQTAIADLKRA